MSSAAPESLESATQVNIKREPKENGDYSPPRRRPDADQGMSNRHSESKTYPF